VALGAAAAGLLAGACAKRVVPTVPEGEDYVAPAPGPGEVSASEADRLAEAWRAVLAGDTARAARDYEELLRRRPSNVFARAGLGYARLRAGRVPEASADFAAALEARPDLVPALVGAGSAAFQAGDVDGALAFYRRAQALAPHDPLVRRRTAGLRLQATERRIGAALAAAARGDSEAAESEYAAALETAPEVAPVRLALAELVAARGDVPGAIALLETDPSGDRLAALRRAELLSGLGEHERAEEVYRSLVARDPADEAARAGERSARAARELASMPEEYRSIPGAARVSRADLAALLAVRVTALRRAGPGEPRVAVDISGSWAREHVARVLALGLMDVYPNHTFQPGATVRRVDLARAAARVLDRLAGPGTSAPPPLDMARGHLDLAGVQRVLGAGLMSCTPAGAFEPWRPVTGAEAVGVVDGLARLVGP
jgi:tetratricopeptide (TPR) repeat protein